MSSGLVKLTITCEQADLDVVKELSSQMLATGKNWPADSERVAKAVTRFLSALGNYSEVYGEITVEDLNLITINSTFSDGDAVHASYMLKLERDNDFILDEGQFLEVSTDPSVEEPVELIALF